MLFFVFSCLLFVSCGVLGSRVSQQPILSTEHFEILTSAAFPLNYSSPAPHIFASVRGLLQQWPNTFFPAGFSIVPCEIPAFVNLYHGRFDQELPPSPEWFAFDIEMSYGIMGSSCNSHMLTYQTTRAVKCLYFDGMSAALFDHHQLDTQMQFIWGNLTGPPKKGRRFGLEDEYSRANGLCHWVHEHGLGGLGWGVEGFVRMNAGFEMIWCDFSSPSAKLISHLNVTAPLLPESSDELHIREEDNAKASSFFPLPSSTNNPDSRSTAPAGQPLSPGRRYEPFLIASAWEWLRSSTWHYGYSGMSSGVGETRVKLLTCGFMSYYGVGFESQDLARAKEEQEYLNLTSDGLWRGSAKEGNRSSAIEALTRRRRRHSLGNLTTPDAIHMNEKAERVLRDLWLRGEVSETDKAPCTGLDWLTLANDIGQRYARGLHELRNTLLDGKRPQQNKTANRKWLFKIRNRMHAFLLPYLEWPATTQNGSQLSDIWSLRSPFGQDTLSRCQYMYTRLLAEDQGRVLNSEESTLKWAVEETLGGICGAIIDVGFSVERKWLQRYNSLDVSAVTDNATLETGAARWARVIEELQAWLGWAGDWISCEDNCRIDEQCQCRSLQSSRFF